jgi:hypothetical protein
MSQRPVTGAVLPLPLFQWFKCENLGLHTSIGRTYIFNWQSCLANGTDVTRLIDFPLDCRHYNLQSLYVYDPEGDQSCGRYQITEIEIRLVTFISRLMHSNLHVVDIKICVL